MRFAWASCLACGHDVRVATPLLIVVDMQNDFADPGGSLYVQGGDEVVGVVNTAIANALAAGSPVFYTQDWHPPATPHFAKDGGIWPVHCVMDTWGADFHPDLAVDGLVVRKGSNGEDGYSGFTTRDPVNGEENPTALAAPATGSGGHEGGRRGARTRLLREGHGTRCRNWRMGHLDAVIGYPRRQRPARGRRESTRGAGLSRHRHRLIPRLRRRGAVSGPTAVG